MFMVHCPSESHRCTTPTRRSTFSASRRASSSRLLGQLDQQPLFNAVNFSRSIFASANATIYATGLEVLWCPSDPSIRMEVEYPFFEDPFKEKIRFSSYAGCTGIWYAGLVRASPTR